MRKTIRQTTDRTVSVLFATRFWLIIGSLILLCYWSGPFGTIEALPGGLRLVYWALIVITTGMLGVWAHALIQVQGWNDVARTCVVGAAFGIGAFGIVTLLSLTMLEPIERYPGSLELFIYSFPSATVVFLISVFFDRPQPDAPQPAENARPILFKRLKTYPAANLILALRAQDHYVEVITDQGSELCLLRLNDAIAEAAPTRGVQIHRSHWVAIAAIKRMEMRGSDQFVCMEDGTKLKVSQSRVKELRQVLGQGL